MGIDSFLKRMFYEAFSQLGDKPGTGCSLDTMDRPQDLLHSLKINDIADHPTWMIDC